MTDNELRGIILRKFYELRKKGNIIPEPDDFDPPIPPEDLFRICDQLGEYNLLDWKSSPRSGNLFHGSGKISAYGVDIIENNEEPPIGIKFIQNIMVKNSQFQIGDGNIQSFSFVLDNFITQIEQANTSAEEKREAKSRLKAFLEHPLVTSVLGGLALELIKRLGI